MPEAAQTIDWTAVKRLLVVALAPSGEAAREAAASRLKAEVALLTVRCTQAESGEVSWFYNGDRYPVPQLVPQLKGHGFDAALILTAPGQSPFAAGYLCYLAGIPIRIGQSCEFGGGVLSLTLPPPDILPNLPSNPNPLHPLLQLLPQII